MHMNKKMNLPEGIKIIPCSMDEKNLCLNHPGYAYKVIFGNTIVGMVEKSNNGGWMIYDENKGLNGGLFADYFGLKEKAILALCQMKNIR